MLLIRICRLFDKHFCRAGGKGKGTMFGIDPLILNFGVAIGIGLLIGAERERRKGEGPTRSPAGIRTFTITALAGAVSITLGGELLLTVSTIGVIILVCVAYWRGQDDDPGLTTEIALVLTVLIGGLSMRQPSLAAGLAVVVAALLAARSQLHRFVRLVLTEDEVVDGLTFAGATLIVLPLLPDSPIGPYDALNLRTIWIVVTLVMAVSGAGYVATRIFGVRYGLPIAGLASGFISSTATIGAMGARAAKTPALLAACVAGAVMSTIGTIVQLSIVLSATSAITFRTLDVALICAGLAAVAYGIAFTVGALGQKTEDQIRPGRAFSLPTALAFALTLSVILLASAALRQWFGERGVVAAAAIAGFVDTHSAAISVASLVASGKMDAADAVIPILAGLSTNTISKIILACSSGGRSFAIRVVPGLILVIVAAWVGALHSLLW
jgi:uncharacterized membrane protein (DUF4010 family)